MSMSQSSEIIEFHHHNIKWFGLLETCISDCNNTPPSLGIIFLHGLGENRTGLNYIFSQISRKLADAGCKTIRFDLAGLGESMLPLSISIWKEQYKEVYTLLRNECKEIWTICRGTGCLAIPEGEYGKIFALNPCSPEIFNQTKKNILSKEIDGIIEPNTKSAVEYYKFWNNLGVETESIGGLRISADFFESIDHYVNSLQSNYYYICTNSEIGIYDSSTQLTVLGEDSLFRMENERNMLIDYFLKGVECVGTEATLNSNVWP